MQINHFPLIKNNLSQINKISFKKSNSVGQNVNNSQTQAPFSQTSAYNIPALNLLNKVVLNSNLTDEEYNRLLDTVEHYTVPLYSVTGYESLPKELRGIIPYAGLMDKSNLINQYLSGRNSHDSYVYAEIKIPVEKTKIKNMIRTLDYSLNKLDEKYGKYDGIVYRTGIINPESPQYYSTSKTQEGAIWHNCSSLPDKQPYNIIYTKSGHKIYEFQKQSKSLLSQIFAGESEILLDRKSSFKEIPDDELTPEMISLKKSFLDKILKIYSLKHGKKEVQEILSNKEKYTDLLSQIKIWENT